MFHTKCIGEETKYTFNQNHHNILNILYHYTIILYALNSIATLFVRPVHIFGPGMV